MNRLFENFFKEKNVLITGHTGFIGSWLSIWLVELGARVIGYALDPYTKKDNFVVTNLKEKLIHIIGDIRNFDKLANTFRKYNPEIVFHLAAQPIVRKSYEIPKETYDVNIRGTINVLEAFRRIDSCRVLINITTDKVYENQEWVWGYRENDQLGGYDPYSSSKTCSEIITSAYERSFFKADSLIDKKMVSTARIGNVIGGGDWQEDRLIPDCMNAIKNNQEIIIRNLHSIRPWQHVLEPIRGLLILAMKMWDDNNKFSGAWNFGPDEKTIFTVKDVVDKIILYMGKGTYQYKSTYDLHETKSLLLNSSKSNMYLKWKTIMNIDEIIQLVCDWYIEEDINYDFDVNQIKYYIKRIKE